MDILIISMKLNYHKFLGDSCQGLGTAPSSSVRSEALCLGKKPAEQKEGDHFSRKHGCLHRFTVDLGQQLQ